MYTYSNTIFIKSRKKSYLITHATYDSPIENKLLSVTILTRYCSKLEISGKLYLSYLNEN